MTRSFGFGWLGLALAIAIGLAFLNVPRFWRIAHDGASTQGVVLRIEPENHQLVRYSYTVGATSYLGSDQLDAGTSSLLDLGPGSPVTVHFSKHAAALSTLGDPRSRLANELSAVLALPAVVVLALVLRLVARRLRPNKSFKPNPLRGSA